MSSGNEDELEVPSYKHEKQKAEETAGRIVWRGANVMMTVFFIMASGVQFNDPDPFLWVPLYGTAAVLTASVSIRPYFTEYKIWNGIYWIHTVYCIGMFMYVLINLVIVATNPQSDGSLNPLTYEEGRELAGIMITVLWLLACKQTPRFSSKSRRKKTQALAVSLIAIFSLLPFVLWIMCYSDVMKSSYISVCSDFYIEEFSF